MNIVVCLKQVPDTETIIKIAGDGKSIETGDIKWIMNPYDEFGVEEALKIKESLGGEVTIVSVGPARVVEALRTALAMGADKAVHVEEEDFYGADPVDAGKALAAVVKDLDADIVFFGQRAVDDDSAIANSVCAEILGIPQITYAVKLEVTEDKVTAHKPVEGATLVMEAPLPVAITAQKGLNEPRYASLPGIMKAKKKPLDIKTLADLGVEIRNNLAVVAINPPPQRAAGRMIEGETPQEVAANLADALRNDAKVI